MKLAFTVTLPDLSRLLSDIGRHVGQPSTQPRAPQSSHSTVSAEARRALADNTEAPDDGQS